MKRFLAVAVTLLVPIASAQEQLKEPVREPARQPVLNYKTILPLLPEPPEGWTAGKPDGKTSRLAMVEISTVSRSYKKEGSKVDIKITDYSFQRAVLKGLSGKWSFTNETSQGYQRSITLEDGTRGFETFVEDGKITNLFAIVADRFWVHVEVRGEKPEVVRDWIKLIDLKALAALK